MSNLRKKQADRAHHLRIGGVMSQISNVITLLSWVGIPVSAILGILKKGAVWWIILGTCVVALVIIWVCHRYSGYIIGGVLGLFEPALPYRLIAWEVEYEYKSMKEMRFEGIYNVKPLQTGVDHIRVRYNWSGQAEGSTLKPKPLLDVKKGILTSRLVADGMEYGYSYYNIYNNSPNNKGDPFTVGACLDPLQVGNQPVSHHLLTSISMVADEHTMRVIFPENIQPCQVQMFEYLHATDDFYWHKYEVGTDEKRARKDARYKMEVFRREDDKKWVIQWQISRPIYGGKYLIRWIPSQT